jgi:ribose transport system permease protein
MTEKSVTDKTQSGVSVETTPSQTTATVPRRRPRAIELWTTAGPFAVFAVLFALVVILRPAFLGGGGLTILATQATAILLIGLGQSMVLHVGSIDLSNAAIALFGAILLAKSIGSMGAGAIILVIVVCSLIGALNGFLIAFFQVPSFALTLGTLGLLSAASLIVSNATTVYATGGKMLSALFTQGIVGLANAFWIAVAVAIVLWAIIRYTVLGQSMTAVGLNETGALFSGIRTRLLKVVAFTLSGLLSSLAGIMIIAQAGSASSTGLGSDLLLPGITAAIVGGTAITGGITNPINVVFGALTVTLIPIGAAALGIPSEAQSLVYGLVIIIAVALTINRKRVGVVK